MNPRALNALEIAQAAENILRFEKARAEWFRAAGLPNPLARDPSDASIGTGNFTQGVPAFWFARAMDYGMGSERLQRPYAESAWVRRAIKYVSGPISSVPLVFSKPSTDASMRRHRGKGKRLFTSRGIVQRNEKDEIELPQIRRFLREPMMGLAYEDFVEASIGWMKLQECFWILGDEAKVPFPEVSKKPFQPIIVARPDRMRPTVEAGKIVMWTFYDANGRAWELDPDQVVRLFGWNPYDPHRGLGDYESAAIAAESHWLGGKFKRNLTGDNDTAPIISPKNGVPTDAQIEQIKMSLAERRAARMRGQSKPIFMPGEIDVHDPKILSVDASFIAAQLEDRHEIFISFGVPPGLADVKASYSIGQASDWFALIFNTCIPEGGKFCAAIEKLIEKLTGEEVEVALDWDDHYVMRQVRSEQMKDADGLFGKGMPMREISEYLNLNLPRYTGDDQGYLPINLMPVTTAGIEAGAETPAPKPEDFAEGDEPQDDVKAMMRMLEQRRYPVVVRSSKYKNLWEQHMRMRSKAVRLYQSKCSKVFNDYRAKAIRHLSALNDVKSIVVKSLLDVIFDATEFGATLSKNLDPVTRAVLQSAGDELMEEIGKNDPWKMPPQDAVKFIASRDKFIKGVGDTARSQLNTALKEGSEKGESIKEITDRVRGVFNNLSRYEARRIAMTETGIAYNFARDKAMTDAGIEYKAWITSHGLNVRESHRQAEEDYGPESPIPIDEPFVVDGEELMYPGDPSGSPGNVINCQCIQVAAQAPTTEGNEE